MIEIGKVTEDSFCWRLMYLHISLIQCCRYLCGNRCICTGLIFAVADAFFETDVSATYFSLNLQILFSLFVMYKLHLHLAFSMPCGYSLVKMCILNLLFLCFTDTPHQNFASSIPKNPLSQISSPISFALLVTSQLEPIHYLQKN